jgi:hypothetical protein
MTGAVRTAILFFAVAIVTGCAVRLGGPSPQQYDALAIHAPTGASASAVAAQIRSQSGDLVLLSSEQDSAWFAAVAAESQLTLSGPGRTGPRGMAFLSRLEVLGDTSLVLEVPGGGSIHMHDALLRVDRNRHIDLMMVRFDAPDLRAAVQQFFLYVASDVLANVPVLLAIDGPTAAIADSAATLMRVHYTVAGECPNAVDIAAAEQLPIRLLYGPSARIACRGARAVNGTVPGVFTRVVVGR